MPSVNSSSSFAVTEYPSAGDKKQLGVAVERRVDFPDLSDVVKKLRVTEAVLYQVAWGVVLGAADLSGDAIFGNVLSGRTERLEGVEEIVGMCINTVPVRVRYDVATTLADVIADVEKQNEDNAQYGFLPLSSVAKNIGTITVFEDRNAKTEAIVKGIFDQTEYDLELQTTEEESQCIIRYNDRRYTGEEIDRLIRLMTSVFDAMKRDVSQLVKDIPLLTESEKEEYRTIKLRHPNTENKFVFIPLKTEKEKILASCMEELLSVKIDNAGSDFFDVGGDSISAIRLSAKLRAAGYRSTVKQIMTLKTVEKIAFEMTEEVSQGVISSGKVGLGVTSADYSYAVSEFGENMIESISRTTPLQDGMLFYALTEDGPAYNTQTVMPVPSLDIGILRGTLRVLARKYDVLRSNFIWTETGGLQVVLKDRYPEINVASGSVKEIAERDLFRGFDLKNDSLFRITYVRGEQQNYLIKNTHHLLADGWSDAIVTEEMKRIYNSILSGEHSEKEPVPTFASYVDYLYRKDKTKAKEYYAEVMNGFIGSTAFPSRKKKNLFGLAQEKIFKLPGIKKKADDLSVRPSDIAQSVWGVFLAKSNGREDAVFGNVISGRNDDFPGLEKMVGMFINTVPVRVRTVDKTLREVLSSVAWQSQNNLEYGFLPLSETGVLPRSVVIYDNNEKDESAYSIVDQTGYDMELECFGEDCTLRYNPDCYMSGDIDYAVQALLALYNAMTESPDTLVSEVRVFNAELEKALLSSRKKRVDSKIVLPKKPLTTEEEKMVASCVEELLSVKVDNANADFFELGGDSISAIRLSAKMRKKGFSLTVKDITIGRTIKEMALRLEVPSGESSAACSVIPLTPVMTDFFDRSYADPDGYVQEILLKFNKRFDRIREALQAVYEHHDMLRATFTGGKLIVPEVSESAPLSYDIYESDDVLKTCAEIKKKVKMSGPTFVAASIRQKSDEYLYLCAHHLVIDGVSWRIVLEDLSLGSAGEKLPEKTDSYLSWAKKCVSGVRISEKEGDFWRSTEERVAPVFTEKGNAPFSTEFSLSKEETRRIAENAGRIFGARRDVTMLAALARAVYRTFGKEETAVLMESHGRQPLFDDDISRTVGW